MTRPEFCLRLSYVALVCALSACTSLPSPPVLPLGPIAVVPARYPPTADFNVYVRGKRAAAGELGTQGAASGAAAGAIVPLTMGPIGVAAYPVIAPFTILVGVVLGGTLGASYGAMHALSAEQAETVGVLIDRAVNQIGINTQLARQVVEKIRLAGSATELQAEVGPRSGQETPVYAELRPTYRAVLEIAVNKIGMAARKGDPPRVALEMQLRARVVCLSEACVEGTKDFAWAGKPRSLDEWHAGGGELLAADFARGYESLAAFMQETLLTPISH